MNVSAVILAGGIGSRLAPISTPEKPKQFLDLTHSGKSLLQQTAARALTFSKPENIITVGNAQNEALLKTQLAQINFRLAHNIILENKPNNTAPAIFLAAQKIMKGLVVILPSDHFISGNFSLSLIEGFIEATKEKIVTFGIKPITANPNFGYILENSFHEKPDEFLAEELIKKNALWNSGIYIAKAELLLEEFQKFCPEFFSSDFRKISFDHAIAEKTNKLSCVEASFEWDDLGSIESLQKYAV